MQIAPQHAKAVGQGPGVRMKKRLLLDGIALHPTNIAPRNIQLATLVVADFADSRLAFCNGTAMSAGEAANAISLDLLVQLAFTDVPIQNITERRQTETSVFILPPMERLSEGKASAGRNAKKALRRRLAADVVSVEPLVGLLLLSSA